MSEKLKSIHIVSRGATKASAELSPEGREQALAVAYALKARPITSVFSSSFLGTDEMADTAWKIVFGARHIIPDLNDSGHSEREEKRVTGVVNTAIHDAKHLGGDIVIFTSKVFIGEVLRQKGCETGDDGYAVPDGSITTLIGPREGKLEDYKLVGIGIVPPSVESLDGGNEAVNWRYNGNNQKSYGDA